MVACCASLRVVLTAHRLTRPSTRSASDGVIIIESLIPQPQVFGWNGGFKWLTDRLETWVSQRSAHWWMWIATVNDREYTASKPKSKHEKMLAWFKSNYNDNLYDEVLRKIHHMAMIVQLNLCRSICMDSFFDCEGGELNSNIHWRQWSIDTNVTSSQSI